MPFQPAPDVVQCVLESVSVEGLQGVNVLHFRDELGVPTLARLSDLYGVINTWLTTEWDEVASVGVTLQNVRLRSLASEAAPFLDSVSATPGLLTGDPVSAGSTWAVTLQTGLTGRSRRGRVYHLGLAEGQVTGGVVLSASANNILNAYQALISLAAAEDFTWCVLSRVQEGVTLPEALAYPIVTVSYSDLIPDTQRRRRRQAAS